MDLDSEELRKNGLKLKLRGQPFRMLAEIAGRSGQVVTYEELRSRFWPEGIFGGHKHSLGNALLKIRKVLGDSAASPRYVETVSRGYRFLAPVEFVFKCSANGKGPPVPVADDFVLEMQLIRQQLPITLRGRDLKLLLYRCEGLREQHVQHPNRHELQLLIDEIKLAIDHAALIEPNMTKPSVSFETAAGVFDDQNALSIQDSFSGERWKTLGLVRGALLLVVDHAVHEENGQKVVRINSARRATLQERRFYEQRRK